MKSDDVIVSFRGVRKTYDGETLVVKSLDDYLAGQRFPLGLIFTDESVLVQPEGIRPLE